MIHTGRRAFLSLEGSYHGNSLAGLSIGANPRIQKREQTSANRWHLEVRLEKPAHVDRQVTTRLRAAYDLAAPRS